MKTIPLTKGFKTRVSDADFEFLRKWRWSARIERAGVVYAQRTVWSRTPRGKLKSSSCQMARVILDLHEHDFQVDHINGNTLDNRRANLRVVDQKRNSWNRGPNSGKKYKGFTYTRGRFAARIRHSGKLHYLGSFLSEVEAARAYDAAARDTFGQYARLNFPDVHEPTAQRGYTPR